nr:hypothetical protein [Tanacetum cinerariifolium]
MDLQDQGVIDSGCSRNMTGNMSNLTDYEEKDGGYVAFGRNPKGGKITGKDYEEKDGGYVAFGRNPKGGKITGKGKFDGKVDEGFFIGYSLNSKAFRVLNSRTRIVEDNFHIRFSENTLNVVGSGPDWLFDIDALTITMNYNPIVVDPKSSYDDGFKPSSDNRKKVDEDPRKENECNDQEKEDNVNNTNNVNTISLTINVTSKNEDNKLPFNPNMPTLEDVSTFNFSNNDEDDGAMADMNNLDTKIQVIPTPTTRIHKDHPLYQIIRDSHLATQTRKMLKNLEEHGFVSTIQQRINHNDLQNCLFACFFHRKNPKKVLHALNNLSWIEAIQEDLL